MHLSASPLVALLCLLVLPGCASTPPAARREEGPEQAAPLRPTGQSTTAKEEAKRRDELELKARAELLCRHHQLGAPAMARLPQGTRANDLIRDVDLFFVRDHPALVVRTPVDLPAAFAEVARHIRCEVESVELRGCTAAVTVLQTRPRWEDPGFPAEALKGTAPSDEVRASLGRWMEPESAPVMETHRFSFSITPSGWRADYELPEKARGLEDPFFAPVGTAEQLLATAMPSEPGSFPDASSRQGNRVTASDWLCRNDQESMPAAAVRVEGQVVVRCVITREGSVKSCRVQKTLPQMEKTVLDSLYGSRSRPVTVGGVPIDVTYTFTLDFKPPR
ncbi:energy transducer TonB [Pyxidicoccus xibeiensis]|uniref:energy transducer TonB n=1 Tax=Pyxidicoccus xibeiensis TaxID=2906759 RepID=UPI0020A7FC93|nr:energy transducer TonB [Pyxidicoccus xibeiensis]MCP3143313.1 energy transducer TonB [Pyxidicoccus xibeiensis]